MTETQTTAAHPFAYTATAARTSRDPARLAVLAIGQCVAIAAMIWLVIGTVNAYAFDLGGDARGARVLAYAEPMPERFGDAFAEQPRLEAPAIEDAHPMNDAWMGLTAVTADGVVAGYVSDAFVEADGTVSELVITPADAATMAVPVFVDVADIQPGVYDVTLRLTLAELRMQDSAAEAIAWAGH